MNEVEIEKLYYSIGEVSDMFNIDQHVLRFWETEFKELKPRKNKAGKRLYRESDIQVISRIRQLLYEERYTIEGARRQLKKKGLTTTDSEDKTSPIISASAKEDIKEIKKGLLELRDLITS